MNLTSAERDMLLGFLEEYSDQMACESCNDYELPNTPENLLLVKEAEQLSSGDDEEPQLSADGKMIYTTDFIILDYLANKIRGE